MPDGQRVAFQSLRDGAGNLYWQSADGTGQAERLTTGANLQAPSSISPDGTSVVFVELRPGTGADVASLSLDGQGNVEWLLEGEFNESYPEVSPDGRWLAYTSDASPAPVTRRPTGPRLAHPTAARLDPRDAQ